MTKETNNGWRNFLTSSGLSGKSVTGIDIYRVGSTTVIEVNFSGGPQFVKFQHGLVEFGGTAAWGDGTAQYNL